MEKPILPEEKVLETDEFEGPEDEGNRVYYCFLYLGFCALLPWSAVLNTFDFFYYKMPNELPFTTYPFANNALVVLSQVWVLTTGDLFTFNGRLVAGFSGIAVILFIIPGLTLLPEPINYWAVFGILIIYGGFSGTAQGTVYTMAANLPFKYMGAVMFGNGLAGFGCNILRGITLAAFPVDPSDTAPNSNYLKSAVCFLWIAAAVTLGCVFMQ